MTKSEFLRSVEKLELAFNKSLAPARANLYYDRFRGLSQMSFNQVVDYCLKTYERFPSIASIYTAMRELSISSKQKYRVVKPYIHYKDQNGYSYTLTSLTGECFNPPEEIKKEDGRILKRIYLEEETKVG